jgi:hypothetical protein
MTDNSCRFNCNICNKYYSSSNSLWNHNKKFHNDITLKVLNNSNNILNNSNTKNYNCRHCSKIFTNVKTRWAHEKKCKTKNIKESINSQILLNLQKKNKELEDKITKLENKSNKKMITKNSNNTNTTNNNSGTINNVTINQFGNENINALSVKEIKQLIKNDNYLIDIIKLLNFNDKYPENHNFCNTSLEGRYISVFNSNTNKIEKINKSDFYDKVLCNSFDKMDNISLVLELNKDMREQIKEKYKNYMDNKLSYIKDIFYKDKIYKKSYKMNINELSYNKNKLVLDTWANVSEIEKQEDISDSESTVNSKYSAFTTDSSEY